ncbi:MAG: hppD [Vampirovibrio sp.]|nr:hppD [Vampirovibrio sp.]
MGYVEDSKVESLNPVGLKGIEFIEFTTQDPAYVDRILKGFGFSKLMKHRDKNLFYYRQNDIQVLVNHAETGFERAFAEQHGPSICAMGWRVNNAQQAYETAVQRGATPFIPGKIGNCDFNMPAIYGIGDSIIYFVDQSESLKGDATGDNKASYLQKQGFVPLESPELVGEKGFIRVDHLTNNVYKGTMSYWADFYKNIFDFQEVRYFDIKGQKTGLTSFALQSPCKTFSIPINEGNESKSQIEEYLRDYRGAGVQHLAFLSGDLLNSVEKLQGSGIDTLDINENYYQEVFQRVPNVTEDPKRIERLQVLVDGDEHGYLLQIFTKNLFGPIFIEMIQRKNHQAFGEGNFKALFESIERDQERRGVL